MHDAPQASTFRDKYNRFFHAEEVPYGLALLRIGLALVLLKTLLQRWPHARELYSTDGVTTQLTFGYGYGELLPVFPGAVAVGLFTLLLVCLAGMAAGWCSRFTLPASFALYAYFTLIDAVGTLAKYSCVATHIMLLMCFTRCGAVLSVDAWLARRRNPIAPPPPVDPVWPRRLIQLLIGIVYLSAAMTKINSKAFFSGERMTSWMLSNVFEEHSLGEHLAMYPAFAVFSAYATTIWEIVFVFTAWRGGMRTIMLSFGVAFHLATYFLLGLTTFPFVFLCAYFAFFSQSDYERCGARLKRWWPRRAVPGEAAATPRAAFSLPDVPRALAFGGVALAAVLVGIQIEHHLDPYGLRRPEGPHELTAIPREEMHAMLDDKVLIREKDKFFAFDVGSTRLAGALVNRRDRFDFGEKAIAQCVLNDPHDDMWLECTLFDEQRRIVDVKTTCAMRELLRVDFEFDLDEQLLPGEYSVVLKSRGNEIAKRSFRVGALRAPVAN